MLGSRFGATTPAVAVPADAEPTHPEPSADVRTLFQTHYAAVWRLLRRFGVPAAQLDDAAQEVFWVAARRFADIEGGREKAFLYGVALRVASNELRRAQANAEATRPLSDLELMLSDFAPSPEESLEQRRALALLDRALARLPLELRTVLVLFELEQMTKNEVAELLELPVGTAVSRLRRAREEFRSQLKRRNARLGRRQSDVSA
jgi:RNA polymerase sigma-70 factor (ECF subfamily)